MAKLGVLAERTVQKPPKVLWRQAALGAFYGLLGGTAFALMASFVDLLLYPDLPLGVDWNLLGLRCSVTGLGLALIGAVTTLWNDTLPGLGSGALVAGLLTLGSALYTSQSSTGLKVMVLIFSLLPVAVLSLPIVLVLRWLVSRHADSFGLKWPVARVVSLILIALALGAGSGTFMKMSNRAVTATRFVHSLLQMGNNEKILAVEGASQHEDIPYRLYQSKSEVSTEGFDIQVAYEGGFVMTCEVILYPGRDPRLSVCQSFP